MAKISFIIPAYNEGKLISGSIDRLKTELKGLDYEIIVAEDGSSDKTAEIIRSMAAPRVRLLHEDARLGKGKAVSEAIKKSKGEIVAFMDADLSTDLTHLKRLIQGIENGASISTGSRLRRGAEVEDTLPRRLARVAYNSLVRLTLGSAVFDHQCGFKAFRKKDILPFLDEIKDTGWFWDTELLVLAQRRGLSVDEFPVKWKQGGGSRVRVSRDSWKMLAQIIRMRFS